MVETTLDHMARGGIRRPARRRLPSLLDRCSVARAALRKDALRSGDQCTRLPRSGAGDRVEVDWRRWRASRSSMCCATSPRPAAGSTPPRTPTATGEEGLLLHLVASPRSSTPRAAERRHGRRLLWVTVRRPTPRGTQPAQHSAPGRRLHQATQHRRRRQFGRRVAAAQQQAAGGARSQRPRPLRDDKIITAWNGLMISSLAYGSTVLGDPHYADAAASRRRFHAAAICRPKAACCAAFAAGRVADARRTSTTMRASSADCSDLYEATLNVRWLREADRLDGDCCACSPIRPRGHCAYRQ